MFNSENRKNKPEKAFSPGKAASVLLAASALLLEALPSGVVLKFAVSPETSDFKSFSYFSLIPYGYGHFAPLITAALTSLLLVILILNMFGTKHKMAIKAVSALAALFALLSLLFENANPVSVSVAVLLIIQSAMVFHQSFRK